MKETRLQINPTCHFELVEFESFPSTLSLDYTEHSPVHGASDSDTTTDIAKEKAREIIAFLLPFAFGGEAGMYAVNDPAYPRVKVGDFTVCRHDAQSLWIATEDGEGGQFSDEVVEEALREMYKRYF